MTSMRIPWRKILKSPWLYILLAILVKDSWKCSSRHSTQLLESRSPSQNISLSQDSNLPSTSTPDRSRSKRGFSRESKTEHFHLYGGRNVPLSEIGQAAENTRRKLLEWLEWTEDDSRRDQLIKVYLCKDSEQLAQVANSYGDRYWSTLPQKGIEFRGGWFAQYRLIAICDSRKGFSWEVSHEICHSVLSQYCPQITPCLEEGMAETIPAWSLFCKTEPLERCDIGNSKFEAQCAETWRQQKVPSLKKLLTLDYFEFHKKETEYRNYALSWSLVSLLARSQEPAVNGRFLAFLQELRLGGSVWETFQRIYNVRTVELLWKDQLRGFAEK